jgi:hypothetical protein
VPLIYKHNEKGIELYQNNQRVTTRRSFRTRMGASLDLLQAHIGIRIRSLQKSTLIYSRLKPVEEMRRVFELG